MFQQAARTLTLDRVLYNQGISFGLVRNERQVQESFLKEHDAVIVQTNSDQHFKRICTSIRRMGDMEAYLTPVFMVPNPSLNPIWKKEVDGITDLDELDGITERTQQIQQQFARLKELNAAPESFEVEILVKTLQFLYTRQMPLVPFPSRHSKVHFHFPFINYFFDGHDEHKIVDVLRLAGRKGWLNGKIVEKVHACPSCLSAHQNLRATCPKCHSVDITEEDLIHHFRCATIAPMSDFAREGQEGLHCPKCDNMLKHIGNDYDKPSTVSNCNGCHHTFQQADYRSLCIDCSNEVELFQLAELDIQEFQLSSKGTSVVLSGTGFGTSVKEAPRLTFDEGIYGFDVFKLLVRQEMLRLKQSNKTSVLGQLKFEGLQADRMAKPTIEGLMLEASQVIKSYLPESAAVSAKSVGSYYFLMPETTVKEAEKLREVFTFNFGKLMEANFRKQKVEVKVQFETLKKK